jgi:5-methylcytosine-specific restriction protein A
MKLCTVCGVVTSRPGSRCAVHARQSNRSRHNALYSTREWQRLSARVLRAWRGQHGNWCPGYQRESHLTGALTVDHVVPLAAGGAPFDLANCSVLCRSCNSTKGCVDGPGRISPLARALRPTATTDAASSSSDWLAAIAQGSSDGRRSRGCEPGAPNPRRLRAPRRYLGSARTSRVKCHQQGPPSGRLGSVRFATRHQRAVGLSRPRATLRTRTRGSRGRRGLGSSCARSAAD